MRLRFTVLATAFAAFVIAAIPSLAGAAPHHNRGLTIHAVPPSINAGDEVDIIGRLKGPNAGGQTVRLWHRINPNGQFTPLGTRTTDSAGRYEFERADGIVDSNRSWFVVGPGHSHSKVVHEHVAALVSIDSGPDLGRSRPGEHPAADHLLRPCHPRSFGADRQAAGQPRSGRQLADDQDRPARRRFELLDRRGLADGRSARGARCPATGCPQHPRDLRHRHRAGPAASGDRILDPEQ